MFLPSDLQIDCFEYFQKKINQILIVLFSVLKKQNFFLYHFLYHNTSAYTLYIYI